MSDKVWQEPVIILDGFDREQEGDRIVMIGGPNGIAEVGKWRSDQNRMKCVFTAVKDGEFWFVDFVVDL